MRLPRFSIASLLVVIGILGVALAALRNPSYLWANVTFSVAFVMLVVAIINAVYGCAARRAYWFGFALFGGAYFAVCSIPGLRDSICPRLASEVLFDLLYPAFAPPMPTPTPTRFQTMGTIGSMNPMRMAGMMNQMKVQMGMGPNGGNAVRKRSRNPAAGGTNA